MNLVLRINLRFSLGLSLFPCFSVPLYFISSTVIQDEQRPNQTTSVKENASLASEDMGRKTLQPVKRGKGNNQKS